ncbi:hypothetical protein DCAR_0518820 [Daucus carota subsp. sativus]|uniref:LOB domain-containing protein n=1 Tax=Daucus carota subsp. sativus TaxID=79200 RepID=A0A162A0H9_DAUCS|nr:hypothetical protein DCAR_0518820 [Daucus carota subsp. sativus]
MAASFKVVQYNYSPCAACKFLKRKCQPDCNFAPYFPPEELQNFISVHKIFGATRVSKLLNEVLPHQRHETVSSLVCEAQARLRDPVYGSFGAISILQLQVERLQKELDEANAELVNYACGYNHCCCHLDTGGTTAALPAPSAVPENSMCDYAQIPPQIRPVDLIDTGEAGVFNYYQTPSSSTFPWNDTNVPNLGGAAGQGL